MGDKYLPCNGTEVLEGEYPELYDLLCDTFSTEIETLTTPILYSGTSKVYEVNDYFIQFEGSILYYSDSLGGNWSEYNFGDGLTIHSVNYIDGYYIVSMSSGYLYYSDRLSGGWLSKRVYYSDIFGVVKYGEYYFATGVDHSDFYYPIILYSKDLLSDSVWNVIHLSSKISGSTDKLRVLGKMFVLDGILYYICSTLRLYFSSSDESMSVSDFSTWGTLPVDIQHLKYDMKVGNFHFVFGNEQYINNVCATRIVYRNVNDPDKNYSLLMDVKNGVLAGSYSQYSLSNIVQKGSFYYVFYTTSSTSGLQINQYEAVGSELKLVKTFIRDNVSFPTNLFVDENNLFIVNNSSIKYGRFTPVISGNKDVDGNIVTNVYVKAKDGDV